jgi:excinuclease ABC subunit C
MSTTRSPNDTAVTAEPLDRKLRSLPSRPGVYLFRDGRGTILYVGKAKSLRARVRSHFVQDGGASLKGRELIRRVADVDSIVVGSEAEALLLEANLIREHRPRFNIQLRDDKSYPYIKVTVQEPFPRVFVTRRLENDGARYFGPYTDVGAMRQALELVKRLGTVRSCRYDLPEETPARPCLDYHIGRCLAPCVGLQSQAAYRAMIDDLLEVLQGRVERVRARVQTDMEAAAARMEFERAGVLKEALRGLASIEQRQRALDVRGVNQDVIGIARDGDRGCAVQMRVRGGRLLGREVDFFENISGESEAALLATAATRFYFGRGEHGTSDLPGEVLFPDDFEDRQTLEDLLRAASDRRVTTVVPVRGRKRRVVELAEQNARHLLEERAVLSAAVPARADDALYELQEALDLKVVPRKIVCFDISHTQGSELVGSCVFFENGDPKKSEYRRYRLRGDWGNDDYRSIAEVVRRYFARRLEEDRDIPDLALIDGGRAQLSAATGSAEALGLGEIAFRSLAKREEVVYLPGRVEPVRLPRSSAALRLLQRIRDEAHRFAVTYNRKLRRTRTLRSALGDIPGIGPARQRQLLERFGSVRAIRSAAVEDLAGVPGFSRRLAETVLEHLRRTS